MRLVFTRGDGSQEELAADHVIAATGYRPDLERLTMLEPVLRGRLAVEERTPVLSGHFESSVPGLYFVGPVAANRFGPLMRFAVGAKFVAPRLAGHLAATARRAAWPYGGRIVDAIDAKEEAIGRRPPAAAAARAVPETGFRSRQPGWRDRAAGRSPAR